MKRMFLFLIFAAVNIFLTQMVKADITYDELVDEQRSAGEVKRIVGENNIIFDDKTDLKSILMEYTYLSTDKAFLGLLLNGRLDLLDSIQVMNLMEKYGNFCDGVLMVKIKKGYYKGVDKDRLAGEILEKVRTSDLLNSGSTRKISKADMISDCLDKDLTILDSVTAGVVAVKTNKDLHSVAEKRKKGTDWETIINVFSQKTFFTRSDYFNWKDELQSDGSGKTLHSVLTGEFKHTKSKKVPGRITVSDSDGILNGCKKVVSLINIPKNYNELSQDEEYEKLVAIICSLTEIDKSIVLESLKKTDKTDIAIKVALTAQKTGEKIEDLLAEMKRYQIFGLFCSEDLKLKQSEIKEIHDKADSIRKVLEDMK